FTLLSNPVGNAFVLNPFGGYEIGHNKEKPTKIFDRPVDLSNYNAIRRVLGGANAAYYIFQKKVTEDNVYRLVLSTSWQMRLPFTDEPFVKSDYVANDKGEIVRQKILSLRRNPRHYIESTLAWNVTPLLGFEGKFKWGSLPPLFEFINR